MNRTLVLALIAVVAAAGIYYKSTQAPVAPEAESAAVPSAPAAGEAAPAPAAPAPTTAAPATTAPATSAP